MLCRLTSLALVLAFASPAEEGFVPLFDGKSLNGWITVVGKPGDWVAEEGVLVAEGLGQGMDQPDRPFADYRSPARLPDRAGRQLRGPDPGTAPG